MNPFAKWPAYLMTAVVLVCSAALALAYWLTPTPNPATVGASTPAQQATEARALPTVPTEIKTRVIHVYPPRLKSDLALPAEAVQNETQHVISTAKVAADDRPHTVTTTLDLQSGQAQSYVRPDPLPWLAINTRGEIGLAYGFKAGGIKAGEDGPIARLQARQDLIQIKAVRLGATATLDQDGEWFAGLGAFYRW